MMGRKADFSRGWGEYIEEPEKKEWLESRVRRMLRSGDAVGEFSEGVGESDQKKGAEA